MNSIVAGLIGLLLGSAINLVVARLPLEGKSKGGLPHCVRCGASLAWWQYIPVLGWLIQGGKGACCKRSLPWIYPLVEVLMAISMVRILALYNEPKIIAFAIFVAVILLITGAIDWLHRSIYTFVMLGAALVSLLASWGLPPYMNILNSVLGAVVAGFIFAIFFALALFMFPGKSAPFGLGDVYLAIFLGASFGLTRLSGALFYGMLLAGLYSAILLILRKMGKENVPEYISYGSFLCLGALFLLWFQPY